MKNKLEEYLKEKGVQKSDLTELGKMAIATNESMSVFVAKHPEEKWLEERLAANTQEAIQIIEREMNNKGKASELRQLLAKEKRRKHSKSFKVLQKNKKVLGKLKGLQSQLKSSPAKASNTVTRTKQIRTAFTEILKLLSSVDPEKINQSERILRKCATDLFKVNGLNRITTLKKELKSIVELKSEEKNGEENKKDKQ